MNEKATISQFSDANYEDEETRCLYARGRASHLTDACHAPCLLPLSPLASPGGGIPDRPPLGGKQGIAP